MAKKPCVRKKAGITRNWIAYLCEALVTSGVMPTWEAATYLTENLFGEKPNPRLLGTNNAYEVTSQFLHRLYQPIVEAASREVHPAARRHAAHVYRHQPDREIPPFSSCFSLAEGQPHQLVMLDAAKAWDLVFQDSESFNRWAENDTALDC